MCRSQGVTVWRKGNPFDAVSRYPKLVRLSARRHLPQSDHAVITCRGHYMAIRREGDRQYIAGMACELVTILSRRHVPEEDSTVTAAGGGSFPIGGES